MSSAPNRKDLIRSVEQLRQSKVLTYFVADRQPISAQISEDAVRPMYDHLLSIGQSTQIDLFVYSRGGAIEVPWRIVTMIREFTEKFSVLVPYKAFSATTLLALGADEIVMGRKAELGPIDPQITFEKAGEPGTVVQRTISAEDVMSYLNFLKEKADLSDQNARASLVNKLVESLDPWFLGKVNRVHSHIRDVARKMLASKNNQSSVTDATINAIIDTLAEKTYQHGHAIGRREAQEIGLNITKPDVGLEDLMWQLFESYEGFCRLQNPIDPQTFVPSGADERREALVIACIESTAHADHFGIELVGRVKRSMPPQLNLNITQNLNLPPGVDIQQVPAAIHGILQQMLQDFQQRAQQIVQDEVRKQMPVTGAWTSPHSPGGGSALRVGKTSTKRRTLECDRAKGGSAGHDPNRRCILRAALARWDGLRYDDGHSARAKRQDSHIRELCVSSHLSASRS